MDARRERRRVFVVGAGPVEPSVTNDDTAVLEHHTLEVFDGIEVVAEKDPAMYQRILERYSIDADGFLMVGNSVVSDVLPVLAIGGQAAHVPYHLTWELERAEPPQTHDGSWELEHIGQVPDLVARLDAAS